MTLQEIIQIMTKVRHDQNLYIFWRNIYLQEKKKSRHEYTGIPAIKESGNSRAAFYKALMKTALW